MTKHWTQRKRRKSTINFENILNHGLNGYTFQEISWHYTQELWKNIHNRKKREEIEAEQQKVYKEGFIPEWMKKNE